MYDFKAAFEMWMHILTRIGKVEMKQLALKARELPNHYTSYEVY